MFYILFFYKLQKQTLLFLLICYDLPEIDSMTDMEYLHWTVDLFKNYESVLKKDGVILFNISYSTDLCKKLLSIYARPNSVVYDPFMGTGTTAVACEEMGFNCIGSELSEAQVEYSKNRLEEFRQKRNNIED